MTTTQLHPEVATFAAQVRAELADLPADDVDELLDGLEADLAESLEDGGALPDAAEYAAELRVAAGLPVRPAPSSGIVGDLRLAVGRSVERVRSNAAAASTLEFATSLRPAWWLVRAWVAAWLVSGLLLGQTRGLMPASSYGVIVLAVFVLVSVQWGRGLWLPARGTRGWLVAGNVLALVLLPFVLERAVEGDPAYYGDDGSYVEDLSGAGLVLDGTPVANIYAYGADGEPISGVQLFDESGRPLAPQHDGYQSEICADETCEYTLTQVPALLENGVAAWNVFPLSLARSTWDASTDGGLAADPTAVPEVPPAPFVKVPAIAQKDEEVAQNND